MWHFNDVIRWSRPGGKQKGSDGVSGGRKSVLCLAAEGGYVETATHLIDNQQFQGNLNTPVDDDGMTLVMRAVKAEAAHEESSNTGTVELLLSRNADVNAVDASGLTALMYATHHERYQQTVQVLIAANADIEAEDEDGYTALMHATRCGHKDKVKTLLTQNANVEAADNEGYTALMHAAMRPPEQEERVGDAIVART